MEQRFDLAVVLGASVKADGQPSRALLRRVAHGAALYHQGRAPRLLLSGGVGRYPPAEAELMRRLMLDHGVPDEAVQLEARSRNTLENAAFCRPLIAGQGWGRVLLVSDGYHLPRALYTFRRFGIRATGSAAPRPRWSLNLLAAHGRELLALLFYIWRIERALRGF